MDRTERVPAAWLDTLIERGSNFEVLRPCDKISITPTYVTDGKRVLRVKCSRQTTPYSGAVAIDYRIIERIAS